MLALIWRIRRFEKQIILKKISISGQKKIKNSIEDLNKIDGISYIKEKKFLQNKKQKIINKEAWAG